MRKILLLAPVLLSACAAAPGLIVVDQSDTIPVRGGGTCNAAGLESYVGEPATQDLGTRMQAHSGASVFRWLPKGAIVTMEFNAGRLNVLLDEQNRVESARCG